MSTDLILLIYIFWLYDHVLVDHCCVLDGFDGYLCRYCCVYDVCDDGRWYYGYHNVVWCYCYSYCYCYCYCYEVCLFGLCLVNVNVVVGVGVGGDVGFVYLH